MKQKLLLSLFAMLMATAAWADVMINATNFPDANFRNWVLSQEYGLDGKLSSTELANVTSIYVCLEHIQSLKGIEYFTALTELECSNNELTALDVSKNTKLTELFCSDNQLTALDVSKNTALKRLHCDDNQLTALDVSKNTKLTKLWCSDNQLTALDVSKNTALTQLWCYKNQLTALDVSKNTALTQLWCNNNQLTALDVSQNITLTTLHCSNNQIKGAAMDALVESLPTVRSGEMQVFWDEESGNVMTTTQVAAAKAKGWTPYIDSLFESTEYAGSEPVNEDIAINEENFPDANFRNYLLHEWYGQDGVLTNTEISGVESIYVRSKNIKSLKGIEYFTALTKLDCYDNQLTALDVSKNTKLTELVCYKNQLTALDVSKNTALTKFFCSENQLTALDVSKNTALINLSCSQNKLTALDVSKNTVLTRLSCYSNQLTTLDVSKNTVLTELVCFSNQLTALGVLKNTALIELSCGKNQLTELNVSKNTALKRLHCDINQLTEINVSQNTALTELWCDKNQLTELNVSQNTALTRLWCERNQIKGAAMDALVKSLPTVEGGTVDDGDMHVIYFENEGNVMTTKQVKAAKKKGWTPKITDGSRDKWNMPIWKEYEGSRR